MLSCWTTKVHEMNYQGCFTLSPPSRPRLRQPRTYLHSVTSLTSKNTHEPGYRGLMAKSGPQMGHEQLSFNYNSTFNYNFFASTWISPDNSLLHSKAIRRSVMDQNTPSNPHITSYYSSLTPTVPASLQYDNFEVYMAGCTISQTWRYTSG